MAPTVGRGPAPPAVGRGPAPPAASVAATSRCAPGAVMVGTPAGASAPTATPLEGGLARPAGSLPDGATPALALLTAAATLTALLAEEPPLIAEALADEPPVAGAEIVGTREGGGAWITGTPPGAAREPVAADDEAVVGGEVPIGLETAGSGMRNIGAGATRPAPMGASVDADAAAATVREAAGRIPALAFLAAALGTPRAVGELLLLAATNLTFLSSSSSEGGGITSSPS